MKTIEERTAERTHRMVCKSCFYHRAGAICGMYGPQECPAIARIDEILDFVHRTHGCTVDPTADRLREAVCDECHRRREAGFDISRGHENCAFDECFAGVVKLIEEQAATEERSRWPLVA